MATLGWLALGVAVVLAFLVRGMGVPRATPREFRRDEFSHERPARLAQLQAFCN